MAVSDGQTITVVKDMGLVTSVFTPRSLNSLQGHLGIGHVRYSTMGGSNWRNAQLVYRSDGDVGFALGHNGNLTNVAALESEAGMLAGFAPSDSDLIAELFARAFPEGADSAADALEVALCAVLPALGGAFSLCLIDSVPSSTRCATRTASGRCVSAVSEVRTATARSLPRKARRSPRSAAAFVTRDRTRRTRHRRT